VVHSMEYRPVGSRFTRGGEELVVLESASCRLCAIAADRGVGTTCSILGVSRHRVCTEDVRADLKSVVYARLDVAAVYKLAGEDDAAELNRASTDKPEAR
jgi:hypothetical protein